MAHPDQELTMFTIHRRQAVRQHTALAIMWTVQWPQHMRQAQDRMIQSCRPITRAHLRTVWECPPRLSVMRPFQTVQAQRSTTRQGLAITHGPPIQCQWIRRVAKPRNLPTAQVHRLIAHKRSHLRTRRLTPSKANINRSMLWTDQLPAQGHTSRQWVRTRTHLPPFPLHLGAGAMVKQQRQGQLRIRQ